MNIDHLQDRISMGMGAAARRMGESYTVFRPAGIDRPLREHNRIIDLLAAFQPVGHGTSSGRGAVVWDATYDGHYTTEGDYLVNKQNIFFVASQRAALPIKCVLSNCTVTISRPAFAEQGSYNGFYATNGAVVISGWPGCFASGQSSVSVGAGPVLITTRTLLLPRLPVAIQTADVVTDGSGASCVVVSAEQNAMGWRLVTRLGTRRQGHGIISKTH